MTLYAFVLEPYGFFRPRARKCVRHSYGTFISGFAKKRLQGQYGSYYNNLYIQNLSMMFIFITNYCQMIFPIRLVLHPIDYLLLPALCGPTEDCDYNQHHPPCKSSLMTTVILLLLFCFRANKPIAVVVQLQPK